MNFNLISPNDNGHTFNVRFNEPIVIPENASVHLNWATFERDSDFKFTKDQTMKIIVEDILPYFDWHNNGAGRTADGYRINGVDRGTDLVITIPSGNYSITELQDAISQGFVKFCGSATQSRTGIDNQSAIVPQNLSLSMSNFTAVVPVIDEMANYLEFGMINNYPLNNITLHPLHKTANIENLPAPDDMYLQSSDTGTAFIPEAGGLANAFVPDAGSWISYTLGAKRYIHTGGQFNQYDVLDQSLNKSVDGFDELEYLNTMILKVKKDMRGANALQGNIFFGLFSEGLMGVSTDGGGSFSYVANNNDPADLANRTHEAVIKTFQTQSNGYVPDAYFGIEVCGTDSGSANQNFIKIYTSVPTFQSEAVNKMILVDEYNLNNGRDPRDNTFPAIGIQTYYDLGNQAGYSHRHQKGTLHIRVFVGEGSGGKKIVFDTNSQIPNFDTAGDEAVFTKEFMREYNDNTTRTGNNLAKAKASIPFSPALFFTHEDDPAYIQYSDFTDSVLINAVDTTQSNLNEYKVEMSSELANLFVDTGIEGTFTTGIKNASLIAFSGCLADLFQRNLNYQVIDQSQNRYFTRQNQIIPQFANEKLSIYLTDLPIKSYKNTNDKNKSGYRKSIIANIPQPFQGTYDGRSKVLGGYTPSLGVVNRLSNQSMTTNNFNVEIRDLETDEPADSLKKTIINFTISAE